MDADRCARWEHFQHVADIGVRGFGESPARAFEQVACALYSIMTDLQDVGQTQAVTLHAEAPDLEILLVDWLNALILETARQGLWFSRFEVRIEGTRLRALAHGEPVSRHRSLGTEVKGATYTCLQVGQQDDGCWRAQCVVDV